MASRFSVDLEELDSIVARLSGLAGFIGDHLGDIEQRVAGLYGTGWEGLAASAYADVHREWMKSATELVDGIREMSEGARGAHSAYTRAVQVNRKMLESGQS